METIVIAAGQGSRQFAIIQQHDLLILQDDLMY
jgi:hypothetical protein